MSALTILLIMLSFTCNPGNNRDAHSKQENAGKLKPVVIELFSSEGCSSCPPAAIVMHEVLEKAARENTPIYLLDFHVDYWDKLGWKDEFAQPAFTARQRQYSKAFGLGSVYTPQAVINGKKEMTGSDSKRIYHTIVSELKRQPDYTISCISLTDTIQKAIKVSYELSGIYKNAVIGFALYQKSVTHKILRGENKGTTLTHSNAVISFQQEPLIGSSGKILIKSLPEPIENYGMLALVQNATTMEVLNACEVKLP